MALAASTPLFVVDRTFDWADVRTAALLWDDWSRIERQVREGLACLRFLEADEAELDFATVESAAEDFRQERNLLAAEDMKGWLECRKLDVDDWLGFIERSVARKAHAGELDSIVRDYPVEDEEVARVAECEAICSGMISATVRRLAAAAVFMRRRADSAAARLTRARDEAVRAPEPSDIERLAIPDFDPSSTTARLEALTRLRAAFDELSASAVTEEALERITRAHLLDWMVVDCRLVSFSSEDEAREALLCVREEGQNLAEMARSTGASETRAIHLLGDLEPEMRSELLSAEKGAPVGPVEYQGRPTLAVVIERAPPTIENALVRDRAEQALIAAAIERETTSGARFLLEL